MSETIETAQALTLADLFDGLLRVLRTDPDGRCTPPMHTYLKTIDIYEGQFEPDAAQDPNLVYPAVLLAHRSTAANALTDFHHEAAYTFSCFAAAQTYLGLKEAQRGTAAVIGALQIITDLRRLLAGTMLGFDTCPPFEYRGEELYVIRKALVVYDVRFYCPYLLLPEGE